MRILILSHNYAPELTGIAPYTTELAEHFAAVGHSITVLTTFPHYPRYRWQERPGLFKTEKRAGVHLRRLRVILPRRPSAAWRILFDTSVGLGCLVNSIGLARPSLIIAVIPTLQSGLAAGLLSKLWRVPAVLLVKDLPLEAAFAVGMLRKGLLYRAGSSFERMVYGMVDRIVVIGERFRGNLLAKGVKPEAISVIPDWIDLDRVGSAVADPHVRRSIAGSDVVFLVLHTGTMGEKQGLRTVIDAAHALRDDPTIRIVLVGDGPMRPQLEVMIKERNLDNVRLLGIQPAEYFPKMLAAADVLLLNQRTGVIDAVVPSKLLHYMAAERPIIAAVNPNSVAAELITDARCGLLVQPEDPIHLAGAIRELNRKPDLRKTLGRAGRDYAEKWFEKGPILERWDRLVVEAAAGTAAKR